MRRILFVVFVAVFAFGGSAMASPVELANVPYLLLGVGDGPGHTGFKLYVDDGSYRLFEDLLFPLGHSSGTFYADASSDPDFSGFASNLTNGINDFMWFWGTLEPGGAGGAAGAGEFPIFGGHDFLGDVITRIRLQVDSLDVSPSDASVHARFIVEGEAAPVPEPSTFGLLSGALLLVLIASKRVRPQLGYSLRRR